MKTSGIIKWGLLAGAAVGAVALLRSRRPAFQFHGKTVFITGGSRGLGLVLARKLGRLGARIAICARTHDQLDRAELELRDAGIPVLSFVCDVTDRAAVGSMVGKIRSQWQRIDVVINNAGIIQMGPFDSLTPADFKSAVETHLCGPLNVVWETLPVLRDQGEGHIVNIASIGGRIAVPHLIPYCTSKFALVGFSKGLSAELAQENITVTTVCPGLMRTGSHANALFKGRNRDEYTWFSIANASSLLSISAEQAADSIINAVRYRKSEVVLGYVARAAIIADAIVPELVALGNGLVSRLLPENGGIGKNLAKGIDSHSNLSPSWLTANIDRASVANNEV